MPPELKLALAKVEAANQRGDQSAIALAMAELEARLQEQSPEFKSKFLGGMAGGGGKVRSAASGGGEAPRFFPRPRGRCRRRALTHDSPLSPSQREARVRPPARA